MSILRMKISLRGADVWRRFLVDEATRVSEFHQVLKIMMGWAGDYPYEFETVDGVVLREGQDVGGISEDDARKMYLGNLALKTGSTLIYRCGPKKEWIHDIEVEYDEAQMDPVCLEGHGICPESRYQKFDPAAVTETFWEE